jgi:hypothetical protein
MRAYQILKRFDIHLRQPDNLCEDLQESKRSLNMLWHSMQYIAFLLRAMKLSAPRT